MRHFRPHLEKRLNQMTRSDDPEKKINNNNKSSLPSLSRSLAPSTIPREFFFLFSLFHPFRSLVESESEWEPVTFTFSVPDAQTPWTQTVSWE